MASDYGGIYGHFTWSQPQEAAHMSRSLSLKWHSAQWLSKDLTFGWCAGGTAGQSLTVLWSSGGSIAKSLMFFWDAEQFIANTLTLEWPSSQWSAKELSLQWYAQQQVLKSLNLQWTSQQRVLKSLSLQWPSENFISALLSLKWASVQWISHILSLKWPSSQWSAKELSLQWYAQQQVLKSLTLQWHSEQWASRLLSLKWPSKQGAARLLSLKWPSSQWTAKDLTCIWSMGGPTGRHLTIQWPTISVFSQSFDYGGIYGYFTWSNLTENAHATKVLTLEWPSEQFTNRRLSLKWLSGGSTRGDLSLKWHSEQWACKILDLRWPQSRYYNLPVSVSKDDWIEVTTVQGGALNPDIVSGHISWKYGQISEAKMYLGEPIPEDCLCTIYIAGDKRRFNGISRSCQWQENGTYLADLFGFLEVAKPNPPKGGLYLGKYIWQNVSFTEILNSSEPVNNNNIPGMIYIMNSCIYYELWDDENTEKGVYKWIYSGLPYTISKMYSDGTALITRLSLDDLETGTNSGYYHDSNNKTLYIRLADQTSPYYHIISVPNIWEGIVPIRLGQITGDALTENILYWETANGDLPYEVIFNLLTCAGYEFEESYRGGICYIDVMDHAGRGSKSYPAGRYLDSDNLLAIKDLTLADSRYQVNGVIVAGFGQGSTAVIAGEHVNMGRGGRFVRYADPGQHSESMAEKFASNYLSDKMLPSQNITFEAPLVVKSESGILDTRNLGDEIYVLANLQVGNKRLAYENCLRVQELDIQIGDGTKQTIKAGDKLIEPEQVWQALKNMVDKYIKHQTDTIQPFSWSWSQDNLDNNLELETTFDIPDKTLNVESLVLNITINRSNATVSSPTGSQGGGGGGDGSSGGGGGASTPSAVHKHPVASLKTLPSAASVSCAVALHTHTNSLEIGTCDDTDNAIQNIDVNSDLVAGQLSLSTDSAIAELTADCCTAVNCSKNFFNVISRSVDVITDIGSASKEVVTSVNVEAIDVASAIHKHPLSGDIGPASGAVDVSPADHDHEIEAFETEEFTNDALHDYLTIGTTNKNGQPVPLIINVGNYNFGNPATEELLKANSLKAGPAPDPADPEMYLSIYIGDTKGVFKEVVGSPAIISDSERTVGPVILNPDYVNAVGTYTLKLGLANKSFPGQPCHCAVSASIQGQIFIDTIFSKGA